MVIEQFRVSVLEMVLSEDQIAIWYVTKKQIEQELNIARHRASNDALIIQQTYVPTLGF